MKRITASLAALMALSLASYADDIFVAPEGRGGMTGANWSNALNGSRDGFHIDVKNAITTAVAGGATEVNVYFAGGPYAITNQLALGSISIPVKLSGGYLAETDGSLAKGETVTKFQRSTYNVRHFYASSLSALRIEGITFSEGVISEKGAKGGAIYLSSSTTVIANCIFADNRVADGNQGGSGSVSFGGGGAIAAVSGSLVLTDCTFSGNYRSAGNANQTLGGAVYSSGTSLSIVHCTFDRNYMDCVAARPFLFGAAIGTYKGSVAISNCTFTGNYIRGCSTSGGGSAGALAIRNATTFRMSDSVISDCFVANASGLDSLYHTGVMLLDDLNSADGVMTSVVERCIFDSHGVPNTIKPNSGSTQVPVRSDITLLGGHLSMTNCLIAGVRGNHAGASYSIRAKSGNVAKKGYAGYSYATTGNWTSAPCSMELVNCTIADGKTYGAFAANDTIEMTLKNCIAYGNSVSGVVNAASIEYSCVQEPHDGVGNFVADPHWTGAPYYHLLTKRAGGAITDGWFGGTYNSPKTEKNSPCLDVGAPESAGLDLEPHPNGRHVNLGAYGGTPWATKTLSPPPTTLSVQ